LSSDRALPLIVVAGLALLLPAAGGCRHDMQNQNKVRPYRESAFFVDGASARLLPAHTVARGDLRADEVYYTGIRAGKPVADLPFPLTREVLLRGRQRYDIFCSPCHDRTGSGLGMVVRRGFRRPSSFHLDRLRDSPVGYFYDVMSNGFGAMADYASQIEPADRWAIAAYIRALQLSQRAALSDVPEPERGRLAAEPAPTPALEIVKPSEDWVPRRDERAKGGKPEERH